MLTVLIVVLLVVVLLGAVNQYVPLPMPARTLINVAVVVILTVWALGMLGVTPRLRWW